MNLLEKSFSISASKLYLILDEETYSRENVSLLDGYVAGVESGITIFQYRNKNSDMNLRIKETNGFFEKISKLSCYKQTCMIINDDIRLANELQTPVHLGQDDFPKEKPLSQNFPHAALGYGVSSHDAAELGFIKSISMRQYAPTYTAFGAMFQSPTKPTVKNSLNELPVFFQNNISPYAVLIGGITIHNLEKLIQAANPYADRKRLFFAVITGIFEYGHSNSAIEKAISEYHIKLAM